MGLENPEMVNNESRYPEGGHDLYNAVEEESFWFNHRREVVELLMKKYVEHGKTFADVGGGTGFIVKNLQATYSCKLIEPNENAISSALNRGIKDVFKGTLNELPTSMKFDAIGLFDVIEHFEDDYAFLKLVHSKLLGNGYVFISVPAFQSLWSAEDIRAGHYRRYTKKALATKLVQLGFNVRYATYLFSILPLPIYLFRTLNGANALAKESDYKKKGIIDWLIRTYLKFEYFLLSKNRLVPFGSSLLVIAQKVK